jgi:carboxymethylenebutenolidase
MQLGGVIVHSEIYQVTGPLHRLCRQIASEGYLVAIGECYHEYVPIGEALSYDVPGTDRGNALKVEKPVEAYDSDNRAIIEYLLGRSDCNGRIGTVGMCLGGHLALRCAFEPEVIVGVCLFATDVHKGSLGCAGDDSLAKIGTHLPPPTELAFVFGKQDGHIPPEGRKLIYETLVSAGADFQWLELNAQHAFVRDELSKGRYDPALAGIAYSVMFEAFKRRLMLGAPSSAEVSAQKGAPGPVNC